MLSESGRSVAASSYGNPKPSFVQQYRAELVRLKDSINRREYTQSVIRGKILLSQEPADDPELRVRVRKLLGAAQVATAQYRAALTTLLPAREIAQRIKDDQDLGSLDNSISWIYLKMERPTVAAVFADDALQAARKTGKFDVRLVILRALIYAKEHDFQHSDALFFEAIEKALDSNDLPIAATAWNFMGRGYTGTAQSSRAEFALTESFRLRELHHLPDLEVSMRDLAEVLADRGDLKTSSVLLDEAVARMGDPKSTTDTWGFLLNRGRVRMMRGDLASALNDLRSALDLARRLDVIPTDDDRVTFESGLANLYALFIDCGNRLYLQNRDPSLKEEIFEAAEENRAASLRALVPQPHDWRTRLPPEHALALARLQTAERSQLTKPDPASETGVRMLRARLDAIEAQAHGTENGEAPASALQTARKALDPDTAILSFFLGSQGSWVWVIEGDRFDVYPLPAKRELSQDAQKLRSSIRDGAATIQLGDALGQKLLGVLPAAVHRKHRWLVALDGELFALPLGALRWQGHYLVENHALLVTPSIRLLKPAGAEARFDGPLAAIGDPVYNRADPRWTGKTRWAVLQKSFGVRPPDPWHLARLTGSGQEAQASVEHWGNGRAFLGLEATKANYLKISDEKPAIIHLATHVIPAARDDRAGMIVFGLNASGEPDFLGMREIALRSSAVKMIVMSGCASGDANALPANGLMGLTRAWLGAGIDDVVATRWASIDDNGPFFAAFYDRLRNNSPGGAAEALRLAQLEMIQSQSFRDKPEYWASYFVIGKF